MDPFKETMSLMLHLSADGGTPSISLQKEDSINLPPATLSLADCGRKLSEASAGEYYRGRPVLLAPTGSSCVSGRRLPTIRTAPDDDPAF